MLLSVLCFDSLRMELFCSIPFRFVSFGFVLEFGSLAVCAFMSQIRRERETSRFYIVCVRTSYMVACHVRGIGGDPLIDGALIA